MPKVVRTQDWEKVFRDEVSDLAKGWNVREKRGKVFLRIRTEETTATAYLPFKWQKDQKTAALNRIQNIYFLVKQEGRDLKTAVQIAAGDAPKLVIEHDWQGAKTKFEKHKTNHGDTIKPETWVKKYEPVISDAVALLMKGEVTNPEDLIDRCIEKWETGSRTREIRAGNLKQFLDFCVLREKFPVAWLLKTKLREHIGKRPKGKKVIKGCEITDQQIINLVNSFPETQLGNQWADAVRLLAEFGLRPIELNHLSVKKDRLTGEEYFFCSYEKRAGGGTTEARVLHPLPLVDDQGEVQQWNLLARWKAKDIKIPSLKDRNAFKQYLNRNKYWKSLKAELAANNENLRPYSLRHSYSLRGHLRAIDAGSMADSMGHSYECHCREYSWASKKTTKSAFERANKTLVTIG